MTLYTPFNSLLVSSRIDPVFGGTITSTLLTLLVVPTFYDSIEISRDRAFAKFRRRAQERNPAVAFGLTFVEAFLTLFGVRALYRLAMKAFGRSPSALGEGRGEGPTVPIQSGD